MKDFFSYCSIVIFIFFSYVVNSAEINHISGISFKTDQPTEQISLEELYKDNEAMLELMTEIQPAIVRDFYFSDYEKAGIEIVYTDKSAYTEINGKPPSTLKEVDRICDYLFGKNEGNYLRPCFSFISDEIYPAFYYSNYDQETSIFNWALVWRIDEFFIKIIYEVHYLLYEDAYKKLLEFNATINFDENIFFDYINSLNDQSKNIEVPSLFGIESGFKISKDLNPTDTDYYKWVNEEYFENNYSKRFSIKPKIYNDNFSEYSVWTTAVEDVIWGIYGKSGKNLNREECIQKQQTIKKKILKTHSDNYFIISNPSYSENTTTVEELDLKNKKTNSFDYGYYINCWGPFEKPFKDFYELEIKFLDTSIHSKRIEEYEKGYLERIKNYNEEKRLLLANDNLDTSGIK